MTLTAMNTVGFERSYNKSDFPGNAVFYDATTGTEFKKGSLAAIAPAGEANAGLAVPVTSTSTINEALTLVGVVAEDKTTTDDDRRVKINAIDGEVYTVSFDGHLDVACGGSTAQNEFKLAVSTSGSTVANDLRGALMYIYDGPGKGSKNTITAHTKGAANTAKVVVSGNFLAQPTTASKAIILAPYNSSTKKIIKGANIGSFLRVSTAARKVSIAGKAAGEGYLNVLSVDPANLKMDVMIAPSKLQMTANQLST